MTVRSGHRASDKFLFCVCATPSSSIHVTVEIYGIEFSAANYLPFSYRLDDVGNAEKITHKHTHRT